MKLLSVPAVALAALSFVSFTLHAQNNQPAPATAAPAAPLPTLRTSTQLAIVDVTVTDQHHHPVHNLKREDFTILENNTSQVLKSFEEHDPPSAADLAKIPPMPQLPAGVFTNFTPAPALLNGPVNILLVDRLNTPTQDQTRLRASLLNYLKNAKPGMRTAIFGLNTQLVLLQGFTTDPALLRAALDKKSNPRASPLMDPSIASGGMAEKASQTITEAGATIPDGSATANDFMMLAAYTKLFEAGEETEQLNQRSQLTLDAMNSLARYLVGIPGRKNLVWFSGSFPLQTMPNWHLAEESGIKDAEFTDVTDVIPEYRETLSLLSRAEVAVYPVDARGAQVLPNVTVAGEGGMGGRYLPSSGNNLIVNDIDAATETIFEEHNTMRDLAWQTGGRAFLDTNDLGEAMADALSDGSSYYTLAYTPTNNDWRGDFRKIEVRLRQHGYTLSYRRGYYADNPAAPPSVRARIASGRAVTGTLTIPHFGPMHLALLHAGPLPTDIVFSVKLVPIGDFTEDTLAPGNEGSASLKPPYFRYGLDFAADPRNMAFSGTADGVRHGNIEFVAFVYDLQGKLVNALGMPIKLDLTGEGVKNVLAHGLPYHEEISVPYKGQYFIRAVVHDLRSDHVGAVEIALDPMHDFSPVSHADPAANSNSAVKK